MPITFLFFVNKNVVCIIFILFYSLLLSNYFYLLCKYFDCTSRLFFVKVKTPKMNSISTLSIKVLIFLSLKVIIFKYMLTNVVVRMSTEINKPSKTFRVV